MRRRRCGDGGSGWRGRRWMGVGGRGVEGGGDMMEVGGAGRGRRWMEVGLGGWRWWSRRGLEREEVEEVI